MHFPLLGAVFLAYPAFTSGSQIYAIAFLCDGRNSSFFTVMAHKPRAIRFASATATIKRGFFSSIRASHGSIFFLDL